MRTSRGVEWGERGSVRRKVVVGVAIAALGAVTVAALPGPSPFEGASEGRSVSWGAPAGRRSVSWG